MLDQLPIPLTPGNQLELSGRLVLIPPEMRDGPLVGVIVDTNPMDNLHDPFLLYVALYPRGCNPRKGTRASGSLHFVYRTSRLRRLRLPRLTTGCCFGRSERPAPYVFAVPSAARIAARPRWISSSFASP